PYSSLFFLFCYCGRHGLPFASSVKAIFFILTAEVLLSSQIHLFLLHHASSIGHSTPNCCCNIGT
ncbi:hypothetical protein LINPERPRIM_LOCUS5055, partial [Linum perenne]